VRGFLKACFMTFAVACSAHAASAPRVSSAEEAVDAQVMGACLDSVAAELVSNAAGKMSGTPRATILILPKSRGSDGYLSHDQVKSELSVSEWESAAPLAVTMRNRSANAEQLPVPSSRQPIRLLGSSEEPVESRNPVVEFYRPGYSTDRRSALVRALFGPTPHGAAFTCLVVLERQGWVVKWLEVSYFA
jgi:hypothetical protein